MQPNTGGFDFNFRLFIISRVGSSGGILIPPVFFQTGGIPKIPPVFFQTGGIFFEKIPPDDPTREIINNLKCVPNIYK